MLALTTLLLAAPLTLQQAPPPVKIEIGQPFPVLAFSSAQSGAMSSVAAFRGKPLLLHIYASW